MIFAVTIAAALSFRAFITIAFNDMHAAEVYFNVMTAIEENEAFSDLGYTTLVVRESQEFSVFDEDGIPLCREFALQILEYFYFRRKLKYRLHCSHWTNAFAFVATNSCELVLIT